MIANIQDTRIKVALHGADKTVRHPVAKCNFCVNFGFFLSEL
jgi:hypothetical protein